MIVWGPEREHVNWWEALAFCESLGDGWRMPDRNELEKAYEEGVEGFAPDTYWSSSEYSYSYAWYQYFNYGNQYTSPKTNYRRVRAVRDDR